MKRIVFVLVAVAALAGVVPYMIPHLERSMERLFRSSESKFRPDTATGGKNSMPPEAGIAVRVDEKRITVS